MVVARSNIGPPPKPMHRFAVWVLAFARTTMQLRALPLPVHLVRPLLERARESCKRRVEHRSHQHRQHPAPEFIGDEEGDVAGLLALWLERPAVLEAGEGAAKVTHVDLQIGP